MDIKWIEDFLSLAATRNFSRSADHRNVTQPAFSRRIRALEAWIGAQLVDRSTYPLTLTVAGKLFNDAASEAIKLLTDARNQLRSEHTAHNMLRVTAGHSLALSFFPEWLDKLNAASNDKTGISARITATNIHDSVLALTEGECDLLLCFYHPQLPILLNPDQYEYVSVGSERVIPVSAPDKSGAPQFRLPGSKSKPTRLLAYPAASFLGRVMELILAHAPQAPGLLTSYESDMAELLKRMALNGHGLAWLPQRSVTDELEDGKLVPAGGEAWSLELEIRVFRSLQNKRPALTRLWETLLASSADAPKSSTP
ncbi:LysR substrate-binding domain-containing protein [Herbaspirillum rhizosphaerae]|uniref:LysR substrate-binding domain-containing protein n=1 Tax=Herbaspirillum rhizosphaerae TaxID=346179 RepID=UPI00067C6697|nr:LysR substrate-binding domain-containing protein [Herbaspirillum rhizosphaerae]